MKCDTIKHLYVPQYETLSIKEILNTWGSNHNLQVFMPIEKELKSLNKQFIVNVAYSVVGEPFKQWVKDMIETRNQDMTKSKNLLINMDTDVAAAFQASTAVSSKYIFFALL